MFKYLVIGLAAIQTVSASPFEKRDDDYLPKTDAKCGDTLFGDTWNFIDENDARVKIWNETGAGDLARAYIKKNGQDYWVQRLFNEIFPDEANLYDCTSDDASCGNPPPCSKWEEKGYTGGFYLFQSLTNLHNFLAKMKSEVLLGSLNSTLAIDQVVGDFHLTSEDVQVPDTSSSNIAAILGAAFGVIGGLGAAFAPIAGVSAVLSGIGNTVAATQPDGEGGATPWPDTNDVRASLSSMVSDALTNAVDRVDKIRAAQFGGKGRNEDDIPRSMIVPGNPWETDPEIFKPAIRVVERGAWLVNNPTEGLRAYGKHVGHQMRQALAWEMLRVGRGARVFINDNLRNKEECEQDANGVWDTEIDSGKDDIDGKSGCWTLLTYLGDMQKVVSLGDDASALWGDKYGMDKLSTYRNAYTCWKKNENAEAAAVPNNSLMDATVPECFFSMEILKGFWLDYIGKGNVELNYLCKAEFPGQTRGVRWPEDSRHTVTKPGDTYWIDCYQRFYELNFE